MKHIDALDAESGLVELMCVTREIQADNGLTVLIHPKELTVEEIELSEIIDKFKQEERCRKRRRLRPKPSSMKNILNQRNVAMAIHTLLM